MLSFVLALSSLAPLGVKLVDLYGVISQQKVNTLEHLGVRYRWSEYSPSQKMEFLEAERAKDELRDIMSRMIGAQVRYTRMSYWMRSSPYGFTSQRVETGNGKRYILVKREDEAPFIEKMFELRIQGNMSDTEIVEEINKLGYKSRQYNRRAEVDKTKVTAKMGGNKLTLKRFWMYIHNPIYAGVICEKWTEHKPVKGQCEGIISFETFNRANRGKLILSQQDGAVSLTRQESPEFQRRKGSHNEEYAFRKVVTCSECRMLFFGSAAKGRYKYYPGYHCNKRGHHYRVPKEKLENAVEELVKRVTFTDDHIDDLMTAIEIVWQKRQQEIGKDEAALDTRINGLKAQALATVDKLKMLSSETAIKYMEEDLMKIEDQIKELSGQKDKLKQEQPISFEVVMQYAKYFLQHIDELILHQSNRLKQADFFSVIFDQTPTYEEIASVTTEVANIPGVNELFRIKKMPISSMVQDS